MKKEREMETERSGQYGKGRKGLRKEGRGRRIERERKKGDRKVRVGMG